MATNFESNLEKAIHARTDAAARAAHDVVDRVAKRAEVSEEKLRESVGSAQKTMQSSLQNARVKGLGARDKVTHFMRQHPVASIGIALGIGALLASRGKQSGAASTDRRAADKTVEQDEIPMH